MKFTRRKALASIGMVGLGSSAVFGSGAFTQTVADREFDLQIAADDSALLSLTTGSETYDAVGTNEVTDSSRNLLEFDFSDSSMGGGVNNQADTAFSQAFKIKNNTTEAVWVWIPAGDQNASLSASNGGLLGSGNRSTEFRVEDSYQSGGNGFSDNSGDGDGDATYLGAAGADGTTDEGDGVALDLSFPPGIPKSPEDVNTEDDPVSPENYGNAAEQSRAFGMTPGGAVQLGSDESVEVGIRFLIRGSNAPLFEEASLLRLTASREEPASGNEQALTDWQSDYSRVDTGQTR